MHGHYFIYNSSRFYYRLFGQGEKLLFCFHGYGRDSYTFGFLGKIIGLKYTIVAIDAPYHGNTQWDNPVFRPSDLVNVLTGIQRVLGKEGNKISLLGFSMGGRIALHITQELKEQVERVVLLAPDGLKFNFWQWFSTHTWFGNKIFDYTIDHPRWLLGLIDLSERWGFLNKSLSGLIHHYLDDREERFVLYRRWIIMRKFRPHLSSIKKTIVKNKIRVRMLFGKYDRVIHSAGGHRFLDKIETYASVKIIEAGHDLLREWHSPTIAELFND